MADLLRAQRDGGGGRRAIRIKLGKLATMPSGLRTRDRTATVMKAVPTIMVKAFFSFLRPAAGCGTFTTAGAPPRAEVGD